jgi:O-antigen ligase
MVKNSQISNYLLLIIILVAVILIFNFFGMSNKVLLVLLGLVIFFISFFKTDFALIILIFSMLLSPEFALGSIKGREVVLRMDDILLLVVFFGWLARLAVRKELGILRPTPLNRPILIYVSICLIATLLGAIKGYVRLTTSIFYFLKYFEYYLLFFMVAHNIEEKRQVKIFVFLLIFVSFIISAYAWKLHFSGVARVTAPFEGMGEANTLGGYLLLIMMVIVGLLLNSPSNNTRVFLLFVLSFAFPAFIFTLSRGSWFGFIPASITLMILTRKGRAMFMLVTLMFFLASAIIFPEYIYKRIASTFAPEREFIFLGKRITLDASAAARIDIWKYGFREWKKAPLLGRGVGTPTPVVDNQYVRVLIEVGIIGLMAFFWIIIAIVKSSLFTLEKMKDDNFTSGLTAGFIAGLIGLLIHAFSAETFIIIRIMEPFWFLAAIVVTLPEITDTKLFETVMSQ